MARYTERREDGVIVTYSENEWQELQRKRAERDELPPPGCLFCVISIIASIVYFFMDPVSGAVTLLVAAEAVTFGTLNFLLFPLVAIGVESVPVGERYERSFFSGLFLYAWAMIPCILMYILDMTPSAVYFHITMGIVGVLTTLWMCRDTGLIRNIIMVLIQLGMLSFLASEITPYYNNVLKSIAQAKEQKAPEN